eukprot:TRINITY_DN1552_c0_g3_i4.p1 TRINITY_DN1552_c0_g3~~TRINITY_DN1552_c0_g3_i4.p1  ORF type:complete len:485 (+),score=110.46 TRINITY_DN1552_c0_g3_i4:160-1455(+)
MYYKKEGKKERCGIVNLKGAKVKESEQKNKKFCFEIESKLGTKTRILYAAAPTEEDMKDWIAVLSQVSAGKKLNEIVQSIPTRPASSFMIEDDKENKKTEISVEDFEMLKVIGKGSFGKVLLVRKKAGLHAGKVFAMKCLNKAVIVQRNEVEHTKAEQSILTKLDFPFLVTLHYSFQTTHKLYFIMDYINGGELFYHLQKEKTFSEDRVRFYGAEIVVGIEYLHSAGVIYRDLKPENLLLTHEGHIVMTDFGLSKEGLHDRDDRTLTFCGTPEYLAPEILEGKGYGKEVDWWSFGTLMYEMLTGLPPFYCEDVQQMYTKIMTAELELPDTLSPEATSLLQDLLSRDPSQRLQDSDDIKKHKFFSSIDWDALVQKKIKPPFVPEVHGEDDTSNIDSLFTCEPVDINDDLNEEPLPEQEQQRFEGFTYVSGEY